MQIVDLKALNIFWNIYLFFYLFTYFMPAHDLRYYLGPIPHIAIHNTPNIQCVS